MAFTQVTDTGWVRTDGISSISEEGKFIRVDGVKQSVEMKYWAKVMALTGKVEVWDAAE